MLKITHVYKSFADNLVLKDISFTLNSGEAVALIGENGAGKTTLLKIMLGDLVADEGEVQVIGTIGYVAQHPEFKDTIRECFFENVEDWQIQVALETVGLNKSLDFKTSKLSGGQKTRLSIAMVLGSTNRPSILLLDEPTNNLDSSALNWLVKFVSNFSGSVLIVSHDRTFIDKTCSKIIELEASKLQVYTGNYSQYRHTKDQEIAHQIEEYNDKISEKKRLDKLVSAYKNKMQKVSSERYDKIKHESKLAFRGAKNSSENNIGSAIKSLKSRIDQIGDIKKPETSVTYSVDLGGRTHASKLILRMEAIRVKYAPGVKNISFELRGAERLRITGKNGSGKSTLLKIANGDIEPDSRKVVTGTSISIGYHSQDVDGLDYLKTALANLENTETDMTSIYRECRALGLEQDSLLKMPGDLSRGQQAKLSFAKLLLSNHDLLILDEPTNHLDIKTQENIEAALEKYKGAILVASHDEYFISRIGVTSILALNN